MKTINKVIVILFMMVGAIFVDLTPTAAVFAEEKSSLDTISTYSLNHKIIVYNDVRILYGTQYAPHRIVDKTGSTIFILSFDKSGKIAKTEDNRVVIIDSSCILSFYGVSFEELLDWYYYAHGGLTKKFIKCEKVVLEIK